MTVRPACHLHGLPPAALAAFPRAVFGEDVIDVAACELVSERPPRRLIGLARVLGIDPSDGMDDAEPVAVHRTVASWLAARCPGIVLLGSAEERQATLLACRGRRDRRQSRTCRGAAPPHGPPSARHPAGVRRPARRIGGAA